VKIVNVVNAVNAVNPVANVSSMKSHKDLDVWRLAVDLATDVYEVTKSFPKEEQYGMGCTDASFSDLHCEQYCGRRREAG